jgi:hypothetical protein
MALLGFQFRISLIQFVAVAWTYGAGVGENTMLASVL